MEERIYFDKTFETCEFFVKELNTFVKFVPFTILDDMLFIIN